MENKENMQNVENAEVFTDTETLEKTENLEIQGEKVRGGEASTLKLSNRFTTT